MNTQTVSKGEEVILSVQAEVQTIEEYAPHSSFETVGNNHVSVTEPETECNLPIEPIQEQLPSQQQNYTSVRESNLQKEYTRTQGPAQGINTDTETSPDTNTIDTKYKNEAEDVTPGIYNDTKNWIEETDTNNPHTTIDKRKHIRYNVSKLAKPIIFKSTDNVEDLIDISGGGIAVRHNNSLAAGDLIPVQLTYNGTKIETNIRIVSATQTRAGAEFVEEDNAVKNQLLYLNIQIEADNHMLATKLSD